MTGSEWRKIRDFRAYVVAVKKCRPFQLRQGQTCDGLGSALLFGSAGCRYIIGADVAGRIAVFRANLDPIAN